MTIMNCNHSDTGWCLDCVQELQDEKDKLREAVATAHDWLAGEWDHATEDPTAMSQDELVQLLNAVFVSDAIDVDTSPDSLDIGG
jgi:hypothetical protein